MPPSFAGADDFDTECIDCDDTDYPYETARSDIWALGLIPIFMIVGRQSWYRATRDDVSLVEYLEDPDYLCKIPPNIRKPTIEKFRAAV